MLSERAWWRRNREIRTTKTRYLRLYVQCENDDKSRLLRRLSTNPTRTEPSASSPSTKTRWQQHKRRRKAAREAQATHACGASHYPPRALNQARTRYTRNQQARNETTSRHALRGAIICSHISSRSSLSTSGNVRNTPSVRHINHTPPARRTRRRTFERSNGLLIAVRALPIPVASSLKRFNHELSRAHEPERYSPHSYVTSA